MTRILHCATLILGSLIMLACSSDGSPELNEDLTPIDSPPNSLTDSLNRLGISTDGTPRLDDDGNEIPATFAPLGRKVVTREARNDDGTTRVVLGPLYELLTLGFQVDGTGCPDCAVSLVDDAVDKPDFSTLPPTIYQRVEASPWAFEQLILDDYPESKRDAARADVDGDGLDELVIVYLDGFTNELRISVTDTNDSNAVSVDEIIPVGVDYFPIADVRVIGGNFDNDVADEIAIGISRRSPDPGPANSMAFVAILDDQIASFAILNEIPLAAIDNTRSISLVLGAGSLDYDGPMELVVVQNEFGKDSVRLGTTNLGADVATLYYVFDDVATDELLVASGAVEVSIDTPTDTQIHQAQIADFDIGNIDDDALEEIVFGGLTEVRFNRHCDERGHVLFSIDDLEHQLVTLAETYHAVGFSNCPAQSGTTLRYAYVNLLDIDGDQDLEIQINQFIFDEIPPEVSNWPTIFGGLPNSIIFRDDLQRDYFDRTSGLITTGDITGDGRDDVISFKNYPDGEDESLLQVFGLRPNLNGVLTMTRLESIPIVSEPFGPVRTNPVIVPIDADADGNTMVSKGTHDYALTQPVPVAALASPPCQDGIGQNTDSCTTTWGQSTTVGVEVGAALDVSAGFHFGAKVDQSVCVALGVGTCTTAWELTVKGTIETSLTTASSQAYELTKTVAYTTGPLEDSIVFTTIPLDIYTYEFVSGDADTLGREMAMSLPREPITFIAETSYYNANTTDESLHIDDDVFEHTAGDITTYPTAAEKTTILAQNQSQVEQVRHDRLVEGNPLFIDDVPLQSLGGLAVGPVSVGEGGGSTEVGLDLVNNESLDAAVRVGFTLDVELSVGPILTGFNVGAGASSNLTVSKGRSTIFQGTVGNIEAAQFAANKYQFGLFSYLFADPDSGIEFQVINYWVE